MKNKKVTITGKVISQQSQDPIADLRVEAWDNDVQFNDFVGASDTNEKGEFAITLASPFYQEWAESQNPDFYFKVYKGDKLILNTADQVLWQMSKKLKSLLLEVNWLKGNEALLKSNYVVKGTVTNQQRRGLADLIVRAYDIDLRNEQLLAKVKTDADGKYEIEYSRNHLTTPGKVMPTWQ